MQTTYSVVLNLALLFMVLFYVYPLKFLFTLTIGALSGALEPNKAGAPIEIHQIPTLMVAFSLGYAAVFGVFALLYRYSYGKRRELELNEYETLRTRNEMIDHTVISSIGVLVAITAWLLPARISFFSVFLLCLSAVYGLIARGSRRKGEKLALERMEKADSVAAP